MTKLYFVRHSVTANNQKRLFNGGSVDSELLQEGVEQARKLGSYLAGTSFDQVTSSPQKRAKETAKHILTGMGQDTGKITLNDNLKEIHFGEWDGTLIAEKEGHPQLANLVSKPAEYDPGSFGGENYEDLVNRGLSFVSQLDYSKENYLIVGHGVMLTSLLIILSGKKISQIRDNGLLDNTSLTVFRSDDGVEFEQLLWNYRKY